MMKLHRRRSKAAKIEFKILAMLAFFSISAGLWNNFRQLWLEENGFSAQEVSSIISLGTLFSAVSMFFVGFLLKPRHLKTFMVIILAVKLVDLAYLLGLSGGGQGGAIELASIIDILTTNLIITSVYPLITTVIKSNKAYSRRKLVEYLFCDVGVLVGGLTIGRTLLGLHFNYTASLLISIIFLLPAITILYGTNIATTASRPPHYDSAIKCITRSKLQLVYMLYAFLAATSFAAALGLKILMLTNYISFSASTATNYLLIVGLLSDVIGIVALRYFTPKNDYLTIFLKFGLRLLAYVVAVLADSAFLSLIAITWSILISTAYEDVSDGHYINLIDNRHQFGYSSIKYVMSYLGEATGLMLCGLMYEFGISAILGVAAAITVVQMGVAWHLITMRQRRRTVRHSASRLRYHERTIDK